MIRPIYTDHAGNRFGAIGVMPLGADGNIASLPDTNEAAKRLGNAFVASTTVTPVNAASNLAIVLANPAGSGKRVFIDLREFAANDPSAILEYQAFVNPTYVPATLATPANMTVGAGVAASATFRWAVAASPTMGGTPASGGFIPVGGSPRHLNYLGILNPGTSLGYLLQGNGGGPIANGVRCVMSMFWREEAYP